ncbi:MAG: TOPRIM nucleotidyl transferase/hydrolase domain-containing protein [Actinomycetota bacterium]
MGMTRDEQRRSLADLGRTPAAQALSARSVVLVEGLSDQLALEALAERRDRNLAAEGVAIVPMAGSKNIGRFLDLYGPRGLDVRLAGLCDAAEEGDFRLGLERAGLGSSLSRTDMERLGFHVCVEDLEDELIRSLGAAAVEEVIAARGELPSFRTFQKQPQWRDRTTEEQLRRFLGTHRGRKIQSAPLLVAALDLTQVPRPFDCVLARV